MSADHVPPTPETLLAQTEWIRALARRLVVDPGTADDVAQDAALVALTKPPSDARAVRGWLRRVVTNLAHNARRGETRRSAREAAVASRESVEATDDVVAQWEIRRRVVEAVLALDEPYRTTILLRFFEGLAAAEAATRLGVPLETVRTRTRRGLEVLRGRLAALDDGRGRHGVAVLLFLARDDGVGGGGTVTGGAVMAVSTEWTVAAAVALLLGLGVTWAVNAAQSDDPTPAKAAGSAETAKAPKSRRGGPPTEETKPAGIDLAGCDRERDLFGVVVDPDGKPVVGASVVVLRKRPWATTLATRDFSNLLVPAEETKSAEGGAFALRLARDDGVSLRVDAAGFALWESESRQAGERVLVRLVPPLTLDVRVLSNDGVPVADAPVRVGIEPSAGERVAKWGRTGADGLARFERVPRRSKGDVSVSAKSLSLAYRSVQFADVAEQTIELTLPAKRTVNGVVIDASSKVGLAGADVHRAGDFGDAVVTDSLGRFEIAAFPKTSIEAIAGGHARGEAMVGEAGDVTIAVAAAARVVGRVVDESRWPLKDVDVALIGNPDRGSDGVASVGGALSDADGAFRIEGLVPGRTHLLRVHSVGRALVARSVYIVPSAPCETRLGDVVLGAPHALRGRVVGADETPAARTFVQIAGPDGRGDFAINDHRLTDDLGRFAFPELPPGVYELDVRDEKRHASATATVPVDGDAGPVVVRFDGANPANASPITPFPVRVLDDEGRPVGGVSVQIGYLDGASPTKKTGDDGSVTLDADRASSNLVVFADTRTFLFTNVRLRPGQTDATVVLRRGKPVAGRVVDEEGAAVVRAWVQAFDAARQVASGSTDAEGAFAFAVPPERNVDLHATIAGGRGDRRRGAAAAWGVAPGSEGVVLRFVREPAAKSLDVEVVDESGAPIVGAFVLADFAGADGLHPIGGETGADGHVRAMDWIKRKPLRDDGRAGLDDLPRAPVLVSACIGVTTSAPNRYWSPLARRVPAEADSVRIVVVRPRRLRGRVVLEDGSPCAGAIVSVSPGAGQGSMNVAESDGRFVIDAPADLPTPFDVYAWPFPERGKARTLGGYDLADAQDRDLEIVLRPVPKR